MNEIIKTVISQNIQGFPNIIKAKKNLQRFLISVKKYDADIIFLQEVFRVNWLEYCEVELINYVPLYKENTLFISGGLVILVKKSIYSDLVNKGYHFILEYNNYTKQGVIGSKQLISHISKKGYLHLNVSSDITNFNLINTHTTSSFNNKNKNFNRKVSILLNQIYELKEYISTRDLTADNLPANITSPLQNNNSKNYIIAGDFNYDIHKLKIFNNEFKIYPQNFRITYPKNKSRIDFILTAGFSLNNEGIVPTAKLKISDHNGVVLQK